MRLFVHIGDSIKDQIQSVCQSFPGRQRAADWSKQQFSQHGTAKQSPGNGSPLTPSGSELAALYWQRSLPDDKQQQPVGYQPQPRQLARPRQRHVGHRRLQLARVAQHRRAGSWWCQPAWLQHLLRSVNKQMSDTPSNSSSLQSPPLRKWFCHQEGSFTIWYVWVELSSELRMHYSLSWI